jgi:hypothetical protein
MDLDLFVCNGSFDPPVNNYITPFMPNAFFINNGDGTFSDISAIAGVTNQDIARGSAAFDYNNDGYMDIVLNSHEYITPHGAGQTPNVILYENQVSNNNNWLKVKLTGVASNYDGIGARVRAKAGGQWQIRDIEGGSSAFSHSSTIAHFGLSNYPTVDSLEIIWPGGLSQILTNVAGNQTVQIVEAVCLNPQNVSFINVEPTQAEATWQGFALATATQIQRRIPPAQGGGGMGTSIAGAGQVSKILTGLQPGTQYQCRLRHNCGAIGFSPWKFKPFATPLTKLDAGERIDIFPNPASERVVFNSVGKAIGKGVVKIVDIRGRVVLKKTIDFQNETPQFEMLLEHISDGLYLVMFSNEFTRVSKKIMIAH